VRRAGTLPAGGNLLSGTVEGTMPRSIRAENPFGLTTPELERALAEIERQLQTPDLHALDALLAHLMATALTDVEYEFLADLRIRAKRNLADTVPDSAVEEVVREMLVHLQWGLLRGSADDLP
jgi:hypothetical protein